MVFPTFFNVCMNLAIRVYDLSHSAQLSQVSSRSCFADYIELLHHIDVSVTHTHILFHILFYHDLSQDIEHSSLRYTVLVLSRTIVSDSWLLCGL